MHPYIHAKNTPNKAAFIMASSGKITTYKELDERSNQIAHLFRARDLKVGDGISIFMENNPRFLEICWAAQRSGLYFTPISSRLTAGEVEYIHRDCNSKLIISSNYLAKTAKDLVKMTINTPNHLMVDGTEEGWESFEIAIEKFPKTPINDEEMGQDMLYSSGTTGKPKGIRIPLKNIPI